jgi:hypothetical protein
MSLPKFEPRTVQPVLAGQWEKVAQIRATNMLRREYMKKKRVFTALA